MVTIVFLMLGLFSRQAALINYLFSLVFIATIKTYEYHMFYAYMSINFLLIFANVSKVNSLDRLRLKLKYSNTRFKYNPSREVSVINYYVLILAGIALVYFDSIFYKFASHNWLTGIGMWLPASLPQVTHVDTSPFLNIKWLALALGYITLAFETAFIFTFFRKKWRVLLLVIGIGLHIGIVIEFPIPWFGLGVIALYLLMVPVAIWRRIKKKLQFSAPRLTFFYDEACPLCNRTRIIFSHLDFLGALQFKGVQTYQHEYPLLKKVPSEELLNNVYSLTFKGKLRAGIDTYRNVFLYLPSLFVLGLLMYLPGIYQLSKIFYKKIARNRITERCTEDNCGYIPQNLPVNQDEIKIFRNITLKDIRIRAIAVALLILVLLQINITYNSKLINAAKEKLGIKQSGIESLIQKASYPLSLFSKTFFGITTHAVFMDSHFNGYNHIIAVEAETKQGKKIWLPIIDKEGHADNYVYSFNWVKWTFRVDAPQINQESLKKGIKDFATFWAVKNGYDIHNISFNIFMKRCDIPKHWEYDFLRKQKNRPWEKIGSAAWQQNNFVIDIPVVESL
jgi:predicted DCC family thiol-disulfide oxidoreductase YuxK